MNIACYFCVVVGLSYNLAGADPLELIFPYDYKGNIDKVKFNEPSGLVFHPARGTIFAVGDGGDLCEIRTDGTVVKNVHHSEADYEGITCDPATGLLYVAVEGKEQIIELDPEDFALRRTFQLNRVVAGKAVLKEGGQGIEGIAFVPDAEHPEGGFFYVVNQGIELAAEEDLSAVCEVVLPLRSSSKGATVSIQRYFEPGFIDVYGLHYDANNDVLILIGDAVNGIFYARRSGELLAGHALPGDNQEGIAVDADGNLYIAQDSGGIIKHLKRK